MPTPDSSPLHPPLPPPSSGAPQFEPIVGIDLGTTNSLVAICDHAGPRVLLDDAGRALQPSVVQLAAAETGDAPYRAIVGHAARDRAHEAPASTLASVKRLMGRSFHDAQSDARYLPYELVSGDRGNVRLVVPVAGVGGGEGAGVTRTLAPEEVAAHVLAELKAIAQQALGCPVRKAVITVPAYFDDAQRQATRVAGRLAGLEVVRIVPEPTAAALAYGLGEASTRQGGVGAGGASAPGRVRHVAVYDLGGGTFDVSILRLTPADEVGAGGGAGGGGETDFYQVLATSGDTRLGGDDLDHAIVDAWLADEGRSDAHRTSAERTTLLRTAERVKIALSDQQDVTIDGRRLTRDRLVALASPLIDRTIACCERALADARAKGLPAGAPGAVLDAVVLVGGSTRVPAVRARVAQAFGMEPYTAIDPDQAVALGAAVQAAILSGARRGSLLLDVIPLSLGIATVGGAVAKLILRNSTLPARATELFSTSIDNQTAIQLAVYQGEREMAADCRKLGEFHLRGLPAMPAGVPQVEVRFLVDANGVLSVSALERRTGLRAQLQVVPNHGLTNEDVARIERESILHARQDMQRHRVVDLITNSTLDLKWIGEKLATAGDQLEPVQRAALEARVAELRKLVEQARADWTSVDPNAFQRAKEAMDRESVRLQEIAIARALRAGQGRSAQDQP
jgi:molecular chaperone DnaK (HSP70)